VDIEICAGGCNAVDGKKEKIDVDLFLSGALRSLPFEKLYRYVNRSLYPISERNPPSPSSHR
jgi:hypothetical protein